MLDTIIVNYDRNYNGLSNREFYKACKDLFG
jgi:hypothetical protein